jgi:Ca2+-binding EF-hand superfamily protein
MAAQVATSSNPPSNMNTSRSVNIAPQSVRSVYTDAADEELSVRPVEDEDNMQFLSDEELLAEKERIKEERMKQKEIDRKIAKKARIKDFSLSDYLRSFFIHEYILPAEELEEYRMLSGLEPEYICKLFEYFHDETFTEPNKMLTKEMFMEIPFVESNPLKTRLALCFGYDEDHVTDGIHSMNFEQFLQGVALFNSHGRREEKLKLAFRMHDIDNDNLISKQDLITYMELVCGENIIINKNDDDKINDIDKFDLIEEVFRESSSDPKGHYISFQDFSRVMAPTDFHTKLLLPF